MIRDFLKQINGTTKRKKEHFKHEGNLGEVKRRSLFIIVDDEGMKRISCSLVAFPHHMGVVHPLCEGCMVIY